MHQAAPINPKSYGWKNYINELIADEISTFSRYYDQLIQWIPQNEDSGILLKKIDSKIKHIIYKGESFPDLTGETETRTIVLLNGTINHHFNIQGLLMRLRRSLARTSLPRSAAQTAATHRRFSALRRTP